MRDANRPFAGRSRDRYLGQTHNTGSVRHTVLSALLILAAAWGLSRPVPECPDRADQAATLPCELAVSAALGTLPADHAAITRIQFLYGSLIPYYPALFGHGEEPPTTGYVLFTNQGGTRNYVDVVAWHGELTAAAPLPYPQIGGGQGRA